MGGTMAATPLSCVAGYFTLEEIDRQNACQKAGIMGDRLTKGLQELIKKYDLPFVAFNQGSVCHIDTVGTMHYSINWSKPWEIPSVLKATSERKKEMQHMGAAYMAEGLVTLAGSRLYTNAQYTPELIDEALVRFDRVFQNVAKKEG
jgi:glutamate-1-semialdehyde 2,1-aminomutase